MKILTESEFSENVDNSKGLVLVDFYATWCGPCRMLSPILEELLEEVETPIYKVDVDESEKVSRKYGILSIPTLILFKDGDECARKNGLCSKEEIKEMLEKFSNN